MPERPMLLDNFFFNTALYGGLMTRLNKKHIRTIVPVDYPNSTVFGIFDKLNQLNFPYRWITRFYCLSKQDAISELETVKGRWYGKIKSIRTMFKELIMDKETSQEDLNLNAQMKFNEVRDAVTAVEADVTSYGYYSSMFVVMAEDEDVVNARAKNVKQSLINLGFDAQIEEINAIDAWQGTLVGNVRQTYSPSVGFLRQSCTSYAYFRYLGGRIQKQTFARSAVNLYSIRWKNSFQIIFARRRCRSYFDSRTDGRGKKRSTEYNCVIVQEI